MARCARDVLGYDLPRDGYTTNDMLSLPLGGDSAITSTIVAPLTANAVAKATLAEPQIPGSRQISSASADATARVHANPLINPLHFNEKKGDLERFLQTPANAAATLG